MTPITKQSIADLLALAEKATPGPWDTDTEQNEGDYGSGEDVSTGFSSYGVYAGNKKVVDTLNSDLIEVEVDSDADENGPRSWAWDEQGRRNAEFIATFDPTKAAELLDRIEELERAYAKTVAKMGIIIGDLYEAILPFTKIEVPAGASDGTWVAETKFCNNQITAIEVRRARAALATKGEAT